MSTWLQIKHFESANEKIYSLFIYYDEFERGNLLSSYTGIHKLGVVYFKHIDLQFSFSNKIHFSFHFISLLQSFN